jgi:hypothetical protein
MYFQDQQLFQSCVRTMRANTHGTLRSPYNFSYLRVWALLKPMKLHYLALARWELLQRHMEELGTLAELDRHEVRLRCRPGVDLEAGHFATLLSSPMLPHEVHCDGHHPWAELRATPEVVPRAVKPEKRLLDDLFGEPVVTKVPPSEPEEDWPVPLEQQPKSRVIAIDVGLHQFFVGGRGAW